MDPIVTNQVFRSIFGIPVQAMSMRSGSLTPPPEIPKRNIAAPNSAPNIPRKAPPPRRPGMLPAATHRPERFPPREPATRNSGGEETNYSKLIEKGNILIINGKEYRTNQNDLTKIKDLGKGVCGLVVLMKHNITGVNIAVKQMIRRNNNMENKRINRDLTSILKCRCDYIVNCFGTILDENQAWLCMEEMNTCLEKLYQTLLPTLIPENIIGQIALSTVKALNYLKVEHQIIHRDIKPSNILLNLRGEIKLCDFGISGILENSIAITNNQEKNAYTAPELISKTDQDVYGSGSDIWSLAITLLEISTGEYPYLRLYPDFQNMKIFQKLVTIIKGDPPSLPRDAGFTDIYCDFIASCLNKTYSERPKFKELLESDFLVRCEHDDEVDVSQWYTSHR